MRKSYCVNIESLDEKAYEQLYDVMLRDGAYEYQQCNYENYVQERGYKYLGVDYKGDIVHRDSVANYGLELDGSDVDELPLYPITQTVSDRPSEEQVRRKVVKKEYCVSTQGMDEELYRLVYQTMVHNGASMNIEECDYEQYVTQHQYGYIGVDEDGDIIHYHAVKNFGKNAFETTPLQLGVLMNKSDKDSNDEVSLTQAIQELTGEIKGLRDDLRQQRRKNLLRRWETLV